MNILLYCLVIISIIFFGCDTSDKSSNDNITIIDLSANQNSVANESLITVKKIIPLETDEWCLIGAIDKIIIKDNRLIIVDISKTSSVFCFDYNGKFIKKIFNIGKGVGEYLSIRDFIEKYNNSGYYLYDKKIRKLLDYDNELNYISQHNVPISINSLVEFHDKSFIVERSVNEYFLNQCDLTFHISNEYLKRPDYLLNYNFNVPFPLKKTGKDNLKYSPSFSNFIYEYKDNTFIKKYVLKDKTGFPDQAFFEANKGVHPGRILPRFQKENFLSFLDFYENQNFLILKYSRGKSKNITFFDKISALAVSYKTSDDTFISLILNNVSAIDLEGRFISYIYPYQLSNDDKNSLDEKFVNAGTNYEDNPVLVYFDVK